MSTADSPPADSPETEGSWAAMLFRPVPIDGLVYLRVVFGLTLIAFVWFAYAKGWNYLTKAEGLIYFPHAGFEWLRPLPPRWMHAPYLLVAGAGGMIAAGFLYRPATVVATIAFGYLLFLDQTIYQNHLYLVLLLAGMLALMPAHRAGSVDALLRPRLRSRVTPAWTLYLIRFQLGIVYFYGGLAKLNEEWLSLRSVHSQLTDLRDTMLPALAPLVDERWFAGLLTYGGVAFDLLIVPMLMWRRTRPAAFAMVTFFHLTNSFIFPIDFFPWFMLAATAVYFPPDFPRRVGRRLRARAGGASGEETPGGAAGGGGNERLDAGRRAIVAALAAYALFQVLFPLRIYLYPGEVYWTGRGDNFSWQMRTMSKQLTAMYLATDRGTGRSVLIEPQDHLVQGQLSRLRTPETFVHLAREIARRLEASPGMQGPVEMRAVVILGLNRGEQRFVFDPNDDLTRGGLHEAARRAVIPREASWPVESVKGELARDLQAALEGAPWPDARGPFGFALRGRGGGTAAQADGA